MSEVNIAQKVVDLTPAEEVDHGITVLFDFDGEAAGFAIPYKGQLSPDNVLDIAQNLAQATFNTVLEHFGIEIPEQDSPETALEPIPESVFGA